MASQDTQKLADRIAKLLESESQSPDLASLYASIQKINHRLDKLEGSQSQRSHDVGPDKSTFRSYISNLKLNHPSLDKFSVAEAIADEIFAGVQKEKACQFEPGKPCDHCSMCNSRGF